MKKVLSLFLVVACMFTLVACGNNKELTPTEPINPSENVTTSPTESPTESLEDKDVEMLFADGKYRTFVPASYEQTRGNNIVIASENKGFIAAAYLTEIDYYEGLWSDMLLDFAEEFSHAVAPYLPEAMNTEELIKIEVKSSKASGYNGVHFWGDVPSNAGDTYKVYGWIVLVDKRPLLVAGIQYEDVQNTELYEKMTDCVGFMSATLQVVK